MMKSATFWAPVAAAAIGVVYFVGVMAPHGSKGKMNLARAASLPVIERGRVKPLDTYARVQLTLLNRRQTYYDEFENKQQAIRWLFNILADGYADNIEGRPVSVTDPEVLKWLDLKPRPIGLYFPNEILAGLRAKSAEVQAMIKKKPDQLSPIERQRMDVAMLVFEQRQLADKMHEVRDKTGSAEKAHVFRIDNDQVLAILNLKPREGFRYSLAEIFGDGDESAYVEKVDRSQRRKFFKQFYDKAVVAANRPEEQRDLQDVKTLELFEHLQADRRLRSLDVRQPQPGERERERLLMVPSTTASLEDWKSLGDSLLQDDPASNPAAASMEKVVRAYALDDDRTFNKEVDSYLDRMKATFPAEMSKVRLEVWFNNFAPFYHCAILYVVVLVLSIISWAVWQEPLRRSAFWLCVVVVVVHTSALSLRMYLTGRPPVTNLYSSAVFIGWGCVLLGLGVELIYRNGIPMAVASILGFATMIIAHHLGGSGDTMEVMQAVLDTNFWLATHVTTVTLGYTATFVAGFFAMVFIYLMLSSAVRKYFVEPAAPAGGEAVYFVLAAAGWVLMPASLALALLCGLWLLLGDGEPLTWEVTAAFAVPLFGAAAIYGSLIISRRFSTSIAASPAGQVPRLVGVLDHLALTQSGSKALSGMIYGTVCFATLLSFVGTVLGGIWADQSWGRFWGWDPKENGAVLIVIMNALILHARWGGMVRERGLALLAIVGNMVTAWSWFGTNQLGVGLHAYGFNKSLALGCSIFWVSQFAMLGLGLMPLRFWRAYAEKPLPVPRPEVEPEAPRLRPGRASTGIQPA
jgi:ABC-type transport system involved in cytochrome c biogenesis permease subunit